jgi:hypothetical protein
MTQEPPSGIGTVAQEAARLIEDMATMARRNHTGDHPGRYAGESAGEPFSPGPQDRAAQPQDFEMPDSEMQEPEIQDHDMQDHTTRGPEGQDRAARGPEGQDRAAQGPEGQGQGQERKASGARDKPSEGVCTQCGAQPGDTRGPDVPSSCQLCPLCRGIGLLRSVRPETVDLLADLAMSVAAGLRDLALWSRATETASPATSGPGGSPDPDRPPVQDIPVDDESEG